MPQNKKNQPVEKKGFHPNNPHRQRYDFPALIGACPDLADFVGLNKYEIETIDFSNPKAVKTLNRALLTLHYGIAWWDIPKGYLCPPIPGRADYIHYAAELLASSNRGQCPVGLQVQVLDIGVGANCVYPIIGRKAYQWSFVGSELDPKALTSAKQIISKNELLSEHVACRLQVSKNEVFHGIIEEEDRFDLTICNPPFHASLEEAEKGTRRKWKNLGKPQKGLRNFGGKASEIWCEGGERQFLRRMARESKDYGNQVLWFSSLVSSKTNLPLVYRNLESFGAAKVKTYEMSQGQKTSRLVAWTFLDEKMRKAWRNLRFQNA